MIITLPLNRLHKKIRTQLPQSKYTGYWRDVAKEIEEILSEDEENEGFSSITVRFRDGSFDFGIDEMEIEELSTYKNDESYSVNLGLFIYYVFENMDIENIYELINPNRDTFKGGLAELENEYVDR